MKFNILCTLLFFSLTRLSAQNPVWELWAQGLQPGVYPHLSVAPNHDIYYSLVGAGAPKGVIYKANTQSATGNFTALPPIPVPASLVNNVMCVIVNQDNEPVAGLYRNDLSEPWLFRFDQATQQWSAAHSDAVPNLGAFCAARASDGTLWVGARWAYVYKSTDGGRNFTRVREDSTIAAAYPCFYPTWNGSPGDGAIFGINIDRNDRIFLGTETAGIVYSVDGGLNWRPAEQHPCQDANPLLRDSSSTMQPLSVGGNAAGIGFTADNRLVWNGAQMWTFNWPNTLGYADLENHITLPLNGIPPYLVTTGQQVSRIVTADNGRMFLHSGGANGAAGIGIYTSPDGLNWTPFNTGITSANDAQSQGSLATDGNQVFFAGHDGRVWRYVMPDSSSTAGQEPQAEPLLLLAPNPAGRFLRAQVRVDAPAQLAFSLADISGRQVFSSKLNCASAGVYTEELDLTQLVSGIYFFKMQCDGRVWTRKLALQKSE